MVMLQVGQPKEVDDLVYGGKLKGGFFLEAGTSNFSPKSLLPNLF